MEQKLVFVDLDGTLLNQHQQVPDSAKEACLAAVANGHRLFMCTGRCVPEIYPWLWDLGITGLDGAGGGYVEVEGEVILDERHCFPVIADVSDVLSDLGADWVWQSPTAINPSAGYLELFVDPPGQEGQHGNWAAYREQVVPYVRGGLPQTASKCLFVLPGEEHSDVQAVRSRFGTRVHIVDGAASRPHGPMAEILPLGCNKAVGMRAVRSFLGDSSAETVAIGDSPNDLELLHAADFSVAMGNAAAPIRAAADIVTSGVNENGLWRAFQQANLLD